MAELCARRMKERLGLLKSALRRDNMVLNDVRQQVLGLTDEARSAWEAMGETRQCGR